MAAGDANTRDLTRRLRIVAALVLLVTPLMGGVVTSTTVRTYDVPGTTAKAVVGHMLRNPVRGDHGAAFANIRPSYTLDIATRENGGQCRIRDITVTIHFSMTLPVAANTEKMSSRLRSAWNSFADFARRHEEAHRTSYIGCANRFVSAAKRQTAMSCHAAISQVRRLFAEARRSCEALQVEFDRREKRVLAGLALFRMAGY